MYEVRAMVMTDMLRTIQRPMWYLSIHTAVFRFAR